MGPAKAKQMANITEKNIRGIDKLKWCANYIPSILTDAGKKDWEIKPILRNASQLLAYM